MQSIQQSQRYAVNRMLNMSTAPSSFETRYPAKPVWKILIFDRMGRDILAPLVKVGGLRDLGVTLHMLIDAKRSPVQEVAGVYFVEPTEENIDLICTDLRNKLYLSFHLNFISPITDETMKRLAQSVANIPAPPLIDCVVDRYMKFVSLSATEFSSHFPRAFYTLYSKKVPEAAIESCLNAITESLLSSLITLESVPIIRFPDSEASPAYLIGKKLNARIRDLLAKTGGSFSSSAMSQTDNASHYSPSMITRPVLLLLDRSIDLNVMIQHTWTYGALVHDILAMNLNRAEVITDKGKGIKRVYDLDNADIFWANNVSKPFPQAAINVNEELTTFNEKMKEMSGGGGSDAATSAETGQGDLTSAINALPEMTERKRSIDMHTTIATALLDEIKDRGWDKFVEVEQALAGGTIQQAISSVEQLMAGEKGSVEDKMRLLLSLVTLRGHQIPEPQLTSLKDKVVHMGGNLHPFNFLQQFQAFKSIQRQLQATGGPMTPIGFDPSALLQRNQAAVAFASNLGSKLLQGVKEFLLLTQNLPICKIAESIFDAKQYGGPNQSYVTVDPKLHESESTAAKSSPSRHGIVFVIGGGNYVESQAIKELAKTSQKSIMYGGTHFVSPLDFVAELSALGEEEGGGN
eukprot:GHVO01000583.1.p1 GENE.GHVO01000583.1~~GHVO01000583.1.p1  ORF type:complete len:648 (-),score=153.15 GHVO01000583.1:147-2048(-)